MPDDSPIALVTYAPRDRHDTWLAQQLCQAKDIIHDAPSDWYGRFGDRRISWLQGWETRDITAPLNSKLGLLKWQTAAPD